MMVEGSAQSMALGESSAVKIWSISEFSHGEQVEHGALYIE